MTEMGTLNQIFVHFKGVDFNSRMAAMAQKWYSPGIPQHAKKHMDVSLTQIQTAPT
jgi:hypothetical protein